MLDRKGKAPLRPPRPESLGDMELTDYSLPSAMREDYLAMQKENERLRRELLESDAIEKKLRAENDRLRQEAEAHRQVVSQTIRRVNAAFTEYQAFLQDPDRLEEGSDTERGPGRQEISVYALSDVLSSYSEF